MIDRAQWLASARDILRFYKIKSEIRTDPFKRLVENIELVYRYKFQKVLDFRYVKRGGYFIQGNGGVIEINSAVVIVEFSEWKEGSSDPIDEYSPGEFLGSENNQAKYPSLFKAAGQISKYREMLPSDAGR